jgi:hypothetical protein
MRGRFKHGQYRYDHAPGSLIKIGRYHQAILDASARLANRRSISQRVAHSTHAQQSILEDMPRSMTLYSASCLVTTLLNGALFERMFAAGLSATLSAHGRTVNELVLNALLNVRTPLTSRSSFPTRSRPCIAVCSALAAVLPHGLVSPCQSDQRRHQQG